MTNRARLLLAAMMALGTTRTLPAEEPNRLGVTPGEALARPQASLNQKVADTIAEHLRQSGQLRHYNIDIVFQDGTAEVSGMVADQPQREEAIKRVQGVPGVERVRDRLTLANPVRQTLGQAPAPLPPHAAEAAGNGAARPASEPMPVFTAPAPGPYDVVDPKMPPHAWPTYAPYNNYSRVAYPELYPYESWPFIGPCYPFPKVPPGWRKVKLEWQDGFWWYSKHSSGHDWWRLRYW